MGTIQVKVVCRCDSCNELKVTYWKPGGNVSLHIAALKSDGWVIYRIGDNDYVIKCPKCKRGKQ